MPGLGQEIIRRRRQDPADEWAAQANPDEYDNLLSRDLSDAADVNKFKAAAAAVRKRLPEFAAHTDKQLRDIYHGKQAVLANYPSPGPASVRTQEEIAQAANAHKYGAMMDSLQKLDDQLMNDKEDGIPGPIPGLKIDNPGKSMAMNPDVRNVLNTPSAADLAKVPGSHGIRAPSDDAGQPVNVWQDLMAAQKRNPGSKVKIIGGQYQLVDQVGNTIVQPASSFFEGNPWYINPPDDPDDPGEPAAGGVDKAMGVFTGTGDRLIQQPTATLIKKKLYNPDAPAGSRWFPSGKKDESIVDTALSEPGYGYRALARGVGGNVGEGLLNSAANDMNPSTTEQDSIDKALGLPRLPSGRQYAAGGSGIAALGDKALELGQRGGAWLLDALGSEPAAPGVHKFESKTVSDPLRDMADENSKAVDQRLEDAQKVLVPQDLPVNDEVGRMMGEDVIGDTAGSAAQFLSPTGGIESVRALSGFLTAAQKSGITKSALRGVYDASPAWAKDKVAGFMSANPGIILADEAAKPNLMAADQAVRNAARSGAGDVSNKGLAPIVRSMEEGNQHQIQDLFDWSADKFPVAKEPKQIGLFGEAPTPALEQQTSLPLSDQRRLSLDFTKKNVPLSESMPKDLSAALEKDKKVLILTGPRHAGNTDFSRTMEDMTKDRVLHIADIDSDVAQVLNGKVMDERSAQAVAYSLSQSYRYAAIDHLARFADDMLGSTGTARMITAGAPGFFARQRTEELGRVFIATPHAFDKDVKAAVANLAAGTGDYYGVPMAQLRARFVAEGTLGQSAIDHLSMVPGQREVIGPTVPGLRPVAALAEWADKKAMPGWKGRIAGAANKTLSRASEAADSAQVALSAPGEAMGAVVNRQINSHYYPGLPVDFPSEDAIKFQSFLGKLKNDAMANGGRIPPASVDKAIQETSEDLINFSKRSGFERLSKPVVPFGKYYTSMWSGALGTALKHPDRFRHLYTLAKMVEQTDTLAHGGQPINSKWKTRSEMLTGYPMVQVGNSIWKVRPETTAGGGGSQIDMASNTFAGDDQSGPGYGSLAAPSLQATASMLSGLDQNGRPAVLDRDVQRTLRSVTQDSPGAWRMLPPGISDPLVAAEYQTNPANKGWKHAGNDPQLLLGNDPWAKAWTSALRANPMTAPFANAPIMREVSRFLTDKNGTPPTREQMVDEVISRAFTDIAGVRKDILVPDTQGAGMRRAAEKKLPKPLLEQYVKAQQTGRIAPQE